MEKFSAFNTNDEPIELPPGFRFHPMDEELITHYLSPKVLDSGFNTRAIGEVDLNKVEPWDLPWRAKMGEKEWYFFCVRDRKYPTGSRTNRATEAGYWKATGKDKEIFRAKILVGMKKTLVFYKGRAPRGEKTNWVMHEYRIEGKNSMHNLPKTKNEWVICRIFKKSSGGKKVHISGLIRIKEGGENSQSSDLPPLTDLSSDENHARITEGSYVTCFSNQMEDPRDKFVDEFSSCSPKNFNFSPFQFNLPKVSTPSSIFSSQNIPVTEYSESDMMQDSSNLRLLLQNNGINMKQDGKPESYQNLCSAHEMGYKPYEDHEFPVISSCSVDLDCLWNY